MWSPLLILVFFAILNHHTAVLYEISKWDDQCFLRVLSEDGQRCKVYGTDACKAFDMTLWTEAPPELTGRPEDIFHEIKVDSYPIRNTDTFLYSSYNITLTAKEKSVTGFKMLVENMSCNDNYSSCRLFDCRGTNLTNPLILNYPCYRVMDFTGCHQYQFKVFSLPQNIGTTYYVTLPHVSRIYPEDFCKWESTLIVNMDRRVEGKIQVQFHKASETYNVQTYLLRLIKNTLGSSNKTVAEVTLSPADEPHALFDVKESGEYFVHLVPRYLNGTECLGTVTTIFPIHIAPPNYHLYFIVGGIIGSFVVLTVVILIAYVLCRYVLFRPGKLRKKPETLLVYSYDSEEHLKAVMAFAQYLEQQGHCSIVMDTRNLGDQDPQAWIKDQVSLVEYIIFILSPEAISGIQSTRQEKTIKGFHPPDKGHPWGDLLKPAFQLMSISPPRVSQKCIMVAWDTWSKREYKNISKHLNCNMYQITKDINRLLAHLHGEMGSFPLCSATCCGKHFNLKTPCHPGILGSDVEKHKEGQMLINAIKKVNFKKESKTKSTLDNISERSLLDFA